MKSKAVILIIVIVITLSITSCSGVNNHSKAFSSGIPEKSMSDSDTAAGFQLVDKLSADINSDNINDDISVFSSYDENSNTFKIKLEVNALEAIYFLEFPAKFNRIANTEPIEIRNNEKALLLKLYNFNNHDEAAKDKVSQYLLDYGAMVFQVKDNKIVKIFDTEALPFTQKDNYEIKYLGKFNIGFYDKATDLKAEYKVHYSEPLKDEYEKRLLKLQDFALEKSLQERNYYNIAVIDDKPDSASTLVLSKYIPGVYGNDVLGVIDYYYSFDKEYFLSKEEIAYSKALNLPVIKIKNFGKNN